MTRTTLNAANRSTSQKHISSLMFVHCGRHHFNLAENTNQKVHSTHHIVAYFFITAIGEIITARSDADSPDVMDKFKINYV